MDYYVRCAQVIIYRNQYVVKCNKCQNLFLALEPFTFHFDKTHRNVDGWISPCSKVYIDRTKENKTFDSYEDDHDKSMIENNDEGKNASMVTVKRERQPVKVDGYSQTDNEPNDSKNEMNAIKNEVTAKYVVSIPKANLIHTEYSKELKHSSSCSENNDSDDEYELGSLSSCDSLDVGSIKTNDSKRKRTYTRRFRWHESERAAIYDYFGDLKNLEKLPSLRQCLDAIHRYPVLSNRTPPQIKSWIDNQRRYK